jgi:hypothetical protein
MPYSFQALQLPVDGGDGSRIDAYVLQTVSDKQDACPGITLTRFGMEIAA